MSCFLPRHYDYDYDMPFLAHLLPCAHCFCSQVVLARFAGDVSGLVSPESGLGGFLRSGAHIYLGLEPTRHCGSLETSTRLILERENSISGISSFNFKLTFVNKTSKKLVKGQF